MKTFHKIIASGFGSGFFPLAPGTAGSFIACIFFYLLNLIYPTAADFYSYSMLTFVFCFLFIIIGLISIKNLQFEWGDDSPKFTIDEIAGMSITILFIPFSWVNVLIGFLLFRFFDILKPFWIRSLEKIKGAWGVMLDDILAGIYANVLLHVILFSYQYF